jgi:hypothetical protein
MARILIADTDDGVANLERILAGHELIVANEMKTAMRMLTRQIYDLIIVGVHFDDSRMFELIPEINKTEKCAGKPVICFCTRDTAMTRTMHESLSFSARTLGAWMYLDQHQYNVYQDPDAELRRIIERCLTHGEREETLAKRVDSQKEREEIHRLRLALESEEWTVELEDELGDLRRYLSKVLLELYQSHMDSDAQHELVRSSRNLNDRVSNSVTASENDMAGKERTQWRRETAQSVSEQELGDREETKGKKGRHKDDEKPKPEDE